MEVVKDFKISDIEVFNIVIATTSESDYEMDRVLLVEDYPKYSDFLVICGGHCSCYDFDEIEWDATIYTSEEVRKLAEGWLKSDGSERIIAPLILDYVKE